MQIAKSIRVNASADQAWELLGPNYARAGLWASTIYVSAARGGPAKSPHAPCAGRVCETTMGGFTETIELYDPARRRLAYSAQGEKMPGFVRKLTNAWAIKPLGASSCEVRMILNADLAQPFAFLMGWMLRMQLNTALAQSIEEFAHYLETGTPHPRKRKTDRSRKARAVRRALAAA